MLKQIQAKLEAKFPGLSKVFLGLIAAQMATKVTEESGIDAAIAELDNAPISITTLAGEFQKEGDRRVTEAKKAFEKANPKPGDPPAPDPAKPPEGETETDKKLNLLLQKIEALESGKTAESNTARLVGILKEKKVPESYYQVAISGRTFKDADELDAFAGTLTEAYTKYNQEQINAGFKEQPQPIVGIVKDPKNDVSPMMKEYIATKEAETKKTA